MNSSGTASNCTSASQAPEYGVKSALKDLTTEVEEAQRIANAGQEAVGVYSESKPDTSEPNNLANSIRNLVDRLGEANHRQRAVLKHLSL